MEASNFTVPVVDGSVKPNVMVTATTFVFQQSIQLGAKHLAMHPGTSSDFHVHVGGINLLGRVVL